MRKLLARLGGIWLRTLRVHWVGPQPVDGGIFLLWHEHLPACIRAFSHRGINVLISSSEDGGLAATACASLGYRVQRGSSSHGGAAGLRRLARAICGRTQNEKILSHSSKIPIWAGMALDGPRGPRRLPKAGSLWLAQFTRLPVIPVWVQARTATRVSSWDRSVVPWPFSRIDVRLGAAFHPQSLEEIQLAMETLELADKNADNRR